MLECPGIVNQRLVIDAGVNQTGVELGAQVTLTGTAMDPDGKGVYYAITGLRIAYTIWSSMTEQGFTTGDYESTGSFWWGILDMLY